MSTREAIRQIDHRTFSLKGHLLAYLPATLVPAVCSLLALGVAARQMEPKAYGVYWLVAGMSGVPAAAMGRWLQQSILRYASAHRDSASRADLLRTLTVLIGRAALGVLIVAAAAYAILFPRLGSYGLLFAVAVANILTASGFMGALALLQADLDSARYARLRLLDGGLTATLVIVFVLLWPRQPASILLGQLCSNLFCLVMPLVSVLRRARPGRYDADLARRTLRYGTPMAAWSVGADTLNLSDRWVIGLLLTPVDLAAYAPVYTLMSGAMGLLLNPLLQATHPLVMDVWARSSEREHVAAMVQRSVRLFLLVAVPLVILASLFAEPIIHQVLGKRCLPATPALPWMVAGLALSHFGMYAHKGLELAERTLEMLVLISFGGLAKIALSFALVPHLYLVGGALASFIAFALYATLSYYRARSFLSWSLPWAHVIRIVAAGATLVVPCAVAVARAEHILALLSAAAVGLACYFTTLFITRELPFPARFTRAL